MKATLETSGKDENCTPKTLRFHSVILSECDVPVSMCDVSSSSLQTSVVAVGMASGMVKILGLNEAGEMQALATIHSQVLQYDCKVP